MKKVLALMLAVPVLSGSLGLAGPAHAQQNCRMVTTYKTERYWSGSRWVTTQMPYFERVCDGISPSDSGSPQPGDEVSKGKFFKDGKPYLNRQYYYGAYVVSPDGKQPVELRSGPGVNYPVVDRVPSGVFLSMTGDMKKDSADNWWVEIHNGTWVASSSSR
jgi:uncharacterized protein YraI